MSERGKHDRIQWDRTADGGDVVHGWWMAIDDRETGDRIDLRWLAATDIRIDDESGQFADVPREVREPLLYDCHTRWVTDDEAEHQCEVEGLVPHRHRCECGRRRTTP